MLKEVAGQTHGLEEMTLKKKKQPTKSQLNVQAQATILSGKKKKKSVLRQNATSQNVNNILKPANHGNKNNVKEVRVNSSSNHITDGSVRTIWQHDLQTQCRRPESPARADPNVHS